MNNAAVTVASNIHSVDPTVKVNSWSSKQKKTLQVTQPYLIHAYNNFMGWVEQIDWIKTSIATGSIFG